MKLSIFFFVIFVFAFTGCAQQKTKKSSEKLCASWDVLHGIVDDHGLLGYVGEESGTLRLEFTPGYYDALSPIFLRLRPAEGTDVMPVFFKQDGTGLEASVRKTADGLFIEFPGDSGLFAMELHAGTLKSLEVDYSAPMEYPEPLAEANPVFVSPKGNRWNVSPSCEIHDGKAVLCNQALQAVFSLAPHFTLDSLTVAEADANVLVNPAETRLLRFECGGRMFDLTSAMVDGTEIVENTLRVQFHWDTPAVSGTLEVACENDEIVFQAALQNDSPETLSLKVVFPHFGGVRISEKSEDDFYFFPYSGGMIANQPLDWRDIYGDGRILHQFLDIFSPSRGAGIYLRIDDEVGKFKVFSLRKGRGASKGYTHPIYPWDGVIDISRIISRPLEETYFVAFSVDYQQLDRHPQGKYLFPPARIGTHAGTWKNGFRRYANWARKICPPRPFPSALTDRWNLRAGFGLESPLFSDDSCGNSYIGRHEHNGNSPGDIIEMVGWWTIGHVAPFEVPLEQDDILGEKYWRVPRWVDPATGELSYSYHFGDYDEYNPQWGGLPRLRAHLDKIRQGDQIPIFYLTPYGLSAGTRAAKRWIPQYAAINPAFKNPLPTPVDPTEPAGIVINYMKFCPCLDTEEYMDHVAETVARVCRETGVDGFRLDEIGGPGYLCLSKLHQHKFAEYGNTEEMAAQVELTRRVHRAMDQVRPGLVLLSEFLGNGFLASQLEGALTYDCENDIKSPARPAPINVTREFFPECKQFEIDVSPDSQTRWKYWFWNANGTYNSCYTEPLRQMLMRNNDAFAFGKVTILEEGFPVGVLVNRFEGEKGRFIRNILNIRTTSQQVSIPVRAGWKYVELLSGDSLVPKDGRISFTIRPKSLLCIAEVSQ